MMDPFSGVWFLRKSVGVGIHGPRTGLGVNPDMTI